MRTVTSIALLAIANTAIAGFCDPPQNQNDAGHVCPQNRVTHFDVDQVHVLPAYSDFAVPSRHSGTDPLEFDLDLDALRPGGPSSIVTVLELGITGRATSPGSSPWSTGGTLAMTVAAGETGVWNVAFTWTDGDPTYSIANNGLEVGSGPTTLASSPVDHRYLHVRIAPVTRGGWSSFSISTGDAASVVATYALPYPGTTTYEPTRVRSGPIGGALKDGMSTTFMYSSLFGAPFN